MGVKYFHPEILILSIFAETIIFSYALLPADISNFKARLKQKSPSFRLVLRDAIKILSRAVFNPLVTILFLFLFLSNQFLAFNLLDFIIIFVLVILSIPLPKNPMVWDKIFIEVIVIFSLFTLATPDVLSKPGYSCGLIFLVASLLFIFTNGLVFGNIGYVKTKFSKSLISVFMSLMITSIFIISILLLPSKAAGIITVMIALGRFYGWSKVTE